MKLIKVNNYYYLLSDETENTGGKFIMWMGDTVEHFPKQGTPILNKYTAVPNSIYSGKPADGYKLIVASTNESFATENKLDIKQIETLLNKITFSKDDLFLFVGFFNEKKKQGIDGEQIFKEFQKIFSDKTEWIVECDMEFAAHWQYDELPKTQVKVNEQGFVTIKSIK